MKSKLRALTNLLIGKDELSYSIYNDSDRINETVEKYNHLLELRASGSDGLKVTHISETVISPLPFYGVKDKDKFDIVCVNLTPDYNKHRIHMEKQSAGENWKNYFDFYTSHKVFDFISEEHSSYFMNMTKLFYAMYKPHELAEISIENMEKNLSVEKQELFKKVIEDKSILFAHLVPFHSEGFDSNINGINHLRENMPSYDQYLTELLDYMKENIEDQGIIMSNGFADSKVLDQLLRSSGGEVVLENQLLTIQKWHNKWAILFNDQPFTRFGLRSDLEIDTVMKHIVDQIKNSPSDFNGLKDYCQLLLTERQEDEFKARGQRIKGSSLKKMSVKNLRKNAINKKEVVVEEEPTENS